MVLGKKKYSGMAVALSVTVIFFISISCSGDKKEFVKGFEDIKAVPSMVSDSVTTLVSDSGRIKYRVFTQKWEMYDKAKDPYWFFPQKVHFERFNDEMKVESVIECDTARYFTRRKLWELKNNVKITNLQGDKFETQSMYWDQRQQIVYSDSFIRIEQEKVILSGIGFQSNQEMTKYTIFKPNGPILLDSDKPDSLQMDPNMAK